MATWEVVLLAVRPVLAQARRHQPERDADQREVRPRAAPRWGRDGRGVLGSIERRRGLHAPGCAQAHVTQALGGRGVRTAVRVRGTAHLAPAAPEPRIGHGFRSRRSRPAVLGHGAGGGGRSGWPARHRSTQLPSRHLSGDRDLERAPIRPRSTAPGRGWRSRHHPSRYLAAQRASVLGGRGEGLGLRHREEPRVHSCGGDRGRQGQASIHESRAGERSPAGWTQRSVCCGCHAVGDVVPTTVVPRSHRARHDRPDAIRSDLVAERCSSGRAGGSIARGSTASGPRSSAANAECRCCDHRAGCLC